MVKTFRAHIRTILFFLIPALLLGCTAAEKAKPTTTPPPEITADYLLKHRIISYAPRFHEKVISTLPYEIQRFDESYRLNLVARIPDKESGSLLKASHPRYYLLLQRSSDGWLDFTAVHTPNLTPLKIVSHYSSIRQGRFYKEYTIDFTLEQLYSLETSGLELLLINKKNETSTVTLPTHYISAFLKMVEENSHR